MTSVTKTDTRGIDALLGEMDANVAQVQPLLFHKLMAEMADQFPAAPVYGTDLEFDDEPWRRLPTLEDLEQLWLVLPAVEIMLHKLAIKAHGEGPDLPMFLAQQRQLADFEVELRKQREALNADTAADGVDTGAAGTNVTVKSAADGRGGGNLPGGSENGDPVVSGRKAGRNQDPGRSPKVPRGRGVAKAT